MYKSDGSVFKQVGDPIGSPATLTFDDIGQGPGAVHDSDAPPAKDCQLDTVQSVKISAEITKGKWSVADLTCDKNESDAKKKCLSAEMPLDIGIPGLSLRAEERRGPRDRARLAPRIRVRDQS